MGVNLVILRPSATPFATLRATMSRHRKKWASDRRSSITIMYSAPTSFRQRENYRTNSTFFSYIQILERVPSVNDLDYKVALVEGVALKHIKNRRPSTHNNLPS